MSWRSQGGMNSSSNYNSIRSIHSRFEQLDTGIINSNYTCLQIKSNTVIIGSTPNNTEDSQINAIWFAGLDPYVVTTRPETSIEERNYALNEDIYQELFVFKGNSTNDRIRLKASSIVFDTFPQESIVYTNDPYGEVRYDEYHRMMINPAGNVGINQMEPKTHLDVNGVIRGSTGGGIMGSGLQDTINNVTLPAIENGYYYCGRLGIGAVYGNTTNTSENNYKLKIQVWGGTMNGDLGTGVTTYVLTNNTTQRSSSVAPTTGSPNGLMYISSSQGGADTNVHQVRIYATDDNYHDVYVYVQNRSGTDNVGSNDGITLAVKSSRLSLVNSVNSAEEMQYVTLAYTSQEPTANPPTEDPSVNRVEVSNNYKLQYGFIEHPEECYSIGTNETNPSVDYGVVTQPANLFVEGNSYFKGNMSVTENMVVEEALTVRGSLYITGEIEMNTVVMQNFQIREKAYIGAGIRLNSDQINDEVLQDPTVEYNQNFIIFDNTLGSSPTTTYQIVQIDDCCGNAQCDFLQLGRVFSQDNTSAIHPDIVITNEGKLGFGTITPQNKMDLLGNISVGQNYVSNQYSAPQNGAIIEGSVGIGTQLPKSTLDVAGSLSVGNIYAGYTTAPTNGMIVYGSTGIGVTNPQEKLDVAGSIRFGDGTAQSSAFNPHLLHSNYIWKTVGNIDENTFINSMDSGVTIENSTKIEDVVSCNAYGNVVAVGSQGTTINGVVGAGVVSVYQWSSDASGTQDWVPMGISILGPTTNAAHFGASVSLDAHGNALAIGLPRYDYVDGNDTLKSAAGAVYIYRWNSSLNTWESTAQERFYGEAGENLGQTTKLSSDGNTLITSGAQLANTNDASTNTMYGVRVYTYDSVQGTWGLITTLTNQTTYNSGFGLSLDVTTHSNAIAVGSPYTSYDDAATNGATPIPTGSVYVYPLYFQDGIQYGNARHIVIFPTQLQASQFGNAVALTEDATQLVVGAPYYVPDGTTTVYGAIYVYKIDDSNLVVNTSNTNAAILLTTLSTTQSTLFGYSLAISADGMVLASVARGDGQTQGFIQTFVKRARENYEPYGEVKALYTNQMALLGNISLNGSGTLLCNGFQEISTSSIDTHFLAVHQIGFYINSATHDDAYVTKHLGVGTMKPTHLLEIEGTDVDLVSVRSPNSVCGVVFTNNISAIAKTAKIQLANGNLDLVNYNSQGGGLVRTFSRNGFQVWVGPGEAPVLPIQALTLDASGNIGLQMAAPRARLDIMNGCMLLSNGLNTNQDGYNLHIGSNVPYNENTSYNTSVGYRSLEVNAGLNMGSNVAIGSFALQGYQFKEACAIGYLSQTNNNAANAVNYSGAKVSGGGYGTSVGSYSLQFNGGNYNVALGYSSGQNNNSGACNTYLGSFSDTDTTITDTVNGSCAIGYGAILQESNTIVMGYGVSALDGTTYNPGVVIGGNTLTNTTTKLQVSGDVRIQNGTLFVDSQTIENVQVNNSLQCGNAAAPFLLCNTNGTTIDLLNVMGNTSVGGSFVVNGNTQGVGIQITNDNTTKFNVDALYGNITTTGTLYSSAIGTSSFKGSLSVAQDLAVQGNLQTNSLTFLDTFVCQRGFNCNGGKFVVGSSSDPTNGDTSILGTFTVDGQSVFQNSVDIASTLTIAGNVVVQGPSVNFQNTLVLQGELNGTSATFQDSNGTANIAGGQITLSSGIYATGFFATSDIRVKKNIHPITNALETVRKLQGVSYNRTDTPDTQRHIGVIAQDVEKVLPEVVEENADGLKTVAYSQMVSVLIEAVKELQEKVERLEKQTQ